MNSNTPNTRLMRLAISEIVRFQDAHGIASYEEVILDGVYTLILNGNDGEMMGIREDGITLDYLAVESLLLDRDLSDAERDEQEGPPSEYDACFDGDFDGDDHMYAWDDEY